MADRANERCLITGATSGIGKAAALELARMGYQVALVARSREKGECVQEAIRSSVPGSNPALHLADVSSQQSLRALAIELRRKYERIDILLNNAGGVFGTRQETSDGIELTFGLNHLGYFLLTNLLIDLLKAAPAARVINVSSQAHKLGRLHFDDLNAHSEYNAFRVYANSKLANILFTYELARRLEGTNISVSALHPGGVRTNFGRDLPGIGGIFFRHFGFLLRSPEKGAETAVWIASTPDHATFNGKYFLDKRAIHSSRMTYDRSLAARLWDVSAEMTSLN